MNRVLKHFFTVLVACVIVIITAAIDYRFGLPLTITCITAILLKLYNQASPTFKFSKLHDYPSMAGQTASMLLKEWPSPAGNHSDPEINFVRTSSLYESSDKLPCHLIATTETHNGQTKVVAHVTIASSTDYQAYDRSKYIDMLQKGVPLSSVKMSAEFSGIDSTFLDDPEIKKVSVKKDGCFHKALLSSLLVKPDYRGCGLGKAMCAYAVKVSQELGIKKLTGGCTNELVPFYKKMGACRMEGEKRKDMPSVRLGNQMYLDVTFDLIQKAKIIASKFN